MFLRISQNSQETTCVRFSCFNKVASLSTGLARLSSCEFCKVSKTTCFTENLQTAASMCFCFPLLETFCKNRNHIIKNWLQLINLTNMPPGSFWALKTLFIRKDVEYSQNESVKETLSTNNFLRKFKWKLYFRFLVLTACFKESSNMMVTPNLA